MLIFERALACRTWEARLPTLTLATWNLRRPAAQPNARSATLRRHIDRVAADVWVLTETHDSITPGAGHAAVSTTGSDRMHWPGERWVTIWSRWPIERLGVTRDPMRAVAARATTCSCWAI